MPAWGEPDYMMSFQALLGFRTLFSGDAIQDTFANHLHNGLFLRFRTCGWPASRVARGGCSTCSRS